MFMKIIKNIPFKVKITLISFFNFLILFSIWRMIFFYSYIHEFKGPTLLYLKSFLIGLCNDTILASILSIPILIIACIPKIKFNRFFQFIYYFYMIIISILIGFLSVIDIDFFQEMGSHLNIQAHMYGFNSGKEPWVQIWVAYPVLIYVFVISFISYMSYKINRKILFKKMKSEKKQKKNQLITILLFFLLITISTNGFKKDSFNPKNSFFSDDMMANHLAVNNIQNDIYSMTANHNSNFYTDNEAKDIFNELLNQNRWKNKADEQIDKFQNDDDPNIVLIILESHTGIHCNYLNSNLQDNITPFLDSLASKSINFKNCYANGTRTAYGLSSIISSYPVIPGYPLNRYKKYQQKESANPTFASIIKEINPKYQTIFMYGGDSNFDEMKPFLQANSFDIFIDRIEDDKISKLILDNKHEGVNPWGVFDEYLFDRFIEVIDLNTENKLPTFTTILSTTNHVPWIIPEKFKNDIKQYKSNKKDFEKSKTTMIYVDTILKNFFNQIKDKEWFKNTIFIITADHGLNIYKNHMSHAQNGLIPFLIYNSNLKPQVINKTVSQIDILPTLLDLINKSNYFDDRLFGCSGFKNMDKGFAFRNNDNNIQWIENGYVYSENIGFDFEEYYLINDKKNLDKNLKNILKKKCRAYTQMAISKIKD